MPDDHASCVADGIAERHGPEVLDGEHERRAAAVQFVVQPRHYRLGGARSIGIDGGPERRAEQGALAAGTSLSPGETCRTDRRIGN